MPINFAEQLAHRKSIGNLRQLDVRSLPIDLTSSDYLGLARSEKLSDTIHQAYTEFPSPVYGRGIKGEGASIVKTYNESIKIKSTLTLGPSPASGRGKLNGSTGSRLLTGNSTFIQNLESYIAQHYGCERSLIFNSGYTANMGLLSAIANESDTIIYDADIHASMKDGIKLSKARSFPFKHQDLNHLEARLSKAQSPSFVCIESVYSMSGDVAPLEDIHKLCEKYGHHLIVDEAHALGVIGEHGEGLVKSVGLEDRIFARVLTFGKGVGAHGAAVLGSGLLCDYLINFSRPFIYTTALTFHTHLTISCALQALAQADEERKILRGLIEYFYQRASSIALEYNRELSTPICPLIIPGNDCVRQVSAKLMQAGIDVRPILSPTVKRGKEQLRVALHAYNHPSEIDAFFEIITKELC